MDLITSLQILHDLFRNTRLNEDKIAISPELCLDTGRYIPCVEMKLPQESSVKMFEHCWVRPSEVFSIVTMVIFCS
jgi:hypothetical protein